MHHLEIVEQKLMILLLIMPVYNLIEYSDNYCDTSGSLWDFKRDKTDNNASVYNDDNAPSFKYKQILLVIQ